MAAPPPYPQWGYPQPPPGGWYQVPPGVPPQAPAEPALPPVTIQLPKAFDSAGPVVAENVRGWDNGKVNLSPKK